MRTVPLMIIVLAIGCESKAERAVPDMGAYPPVPTISAAPGSKPPSPAADPAPEAVVEDEEAEADGIGEVAEPSEAPAKKRRSSGSKGGVDGIGTSGSGSGGGGVADGVDGLLEADAPSSWRVHLVSTDSSDETKTKQMLGRREGALRRCASFLGKEANRLRCDVSFDGGIPKSVVTRPRNDTAGECVKSQLAATRFPGPPTKLSFEFRR